MLETGRMPQQLATNLGMEVQGFPPIIITVTAIASLVVKAFPSALPCFSVGSVLVSVLPSYFSATDVLP